MIDYWWSTPILSVFQLYHGIRHSDWLLVINTNLVSISVMPWYKTQWLIIGDQLQSCQYFSYTMVYDTVIDYWWSTPILSVFQLYHDIRHSDWLLVINSNLVSISVMPWYKTQWLIIGDQSVFQLWHGIRHSDWLLVINSNLVSISVYTMLDYKTPCIRLSLITGDQLQSCQYFSYTMV